MSRENLEIVRWAYEEMFPRRSVDVPGIEDRFAPDYRFNTRPGFPGRIRYPLDELPAIWADLDSTYTDYSLVPQSYEPLGADFVLVTLRQEARLRGSDQRIDQTIYHLSRLAEGRLQESWTFIDEAEAREAAGLSE